MKDKNITNSREYLTVLLRRRSVVAFCCGILTLALAFYGIIAGVNKTITVLHEDGFVSFIYYTMISNTLAALSMAFVFPYAIDGIRKKRFTPPKWVAVLHYMVTTSITITMVVVIAFISTTSLDEAYGGGSLLTHVICPMLILISFFQMENGHILTWKDMLLGVIPFCVYMIIYYIEVLVIGKSNGGWSDIYHIQEHLSPVFAVVIAMVVAFGVSAAIAGISNCVTKKRKKKMYLFWSDDLEPIEVRIEALGMGMMAGRCSEKNNIQIPYDILGELAQKYNMETEDLIKPFVKGLMIELNEQESN